jgi:hypothetical protein
MILLSNLSKERFRSKTSPEHVKHQEEFLRTKKNPWKYWGR